MHSLLEFIVFQGLDIPDIQLVMESVSLHASRRNNAQRDTLSMCALVALEPQDRSVCCVWCGLIRKVIHNILHSARKTIHIVHAISQCYRSTYSWTHTHVHLHTHKDIQWSFRIKDTLGGWLVLYLEAVLWWEIRMGTIIISIGVIASVLYLDVVLWREGPSYEAPLYTHAHTQLLYTHTHTSIMCAQCHT